MTTPDPSLLQSKEEAPVTNLVEGIREQQARVRDVLIPRYEEIGPNGAIGLIFLRAAVEEGDRALASDDVVRMLRAYKDLEGCE